MKAARYYGKEDLRIDDVPEPQVRPGAVKIAPAWTGICGSDLHVYFEGPMNPMPTAGNPHPLSAEEPPLVFGHEFSGVVEDVGEGVEGLAPGDSVVVEPLIVCGECFACRDGRYNLCEKLGFIGLSGRGGGLSERIVVEERFVHPVGDMPLDQAALIEPLAVAAHGVRLSGAGDGDVALVGGAGPIGLFTCAVLKALGATVIVSEMSQKRKEKAKDSGVADHVLDPAQDDVVARTMEITGGRGADVGFECAGVQPVFDALLHALRTGGILQVIALFSKQPTLDTGPLLFKEVKIQGSMGYAHDHPNAIRLVREGKIDLTPFITRRISVEDIVPEGLQRLMEHKDEEVKILVHL
ncbi:2,3-butanediol dehydrogenase [Streptomyces sp. B21-105]|uniref:2,3-butanediol dehydrogenase n=1 Tax=Streptomyces sp. B21-105 TaxID=3039417 RepID=UPI002FEFA0BC|nr:2,3-butanediol dehydrogenase [Streptomyces canus]